MKSQFLFVCAFLSISIYLAYGSQAPDDATQDRGFWSDVQNNINSLLGYSQAPVETSADEGPKEIGSNCNVIIYGNLMVTGTIVSSQPAPPIPVFSGCPNPKMVHGSFTTPANEKPPVIISGSGSCTQQCNWSVIRVTSPSVSSKYLVTFNTAFLTIPTVVAVSAKVGGGGVVTVDTVTTKSILFDTSSSPDAIQFIAISCCG